MTNKEAIKWLEQIKDKYIRGGDEEFDHNRKIALDMGIDALRKVERDQSRIGDDPYRCIIHKDKLI
jgi:hypothetical protein